MRPLPHPLLPLLATLLLSLLLGACATQHPSRPAVPDRFRTGSDPRFPPDRYLVGVGEGATREGAHRQAVASIAMQLQASLHATDFLHAAASSDGEDEERLVQEIRVRSHFDRPEWVRLVDSHAAGGRVHVLGVVDRSQAAALLEAEQEVLRTTLRLQLKAAADGATLRQSALALAEARQSLERLLPGEATLAALRGRPPPGPQEAELLARAERELERRRRELALQVCVEPAVAAGPAGDVASRFAAILAGEGVQALPCDATTPGWRLTGRVVAHTLLAPPQPGSYRRFCTVRLDYRLGSDQELLQGGSAGGVRNRAGGHDFHDACERSAASLARGLAVELGLRDPPVRTVH